MHIPDGYLSPATCAVTFAMAAPVLYVASRKVGRRLHTRLLPLMAVMSAFCFVIMMFNLPLPGGTTGHAVGLGLAPIVLGPWGASIAISAALLIQALFFGDGGITALGANILNMAIIGPFVAFGIYGLMAGRAPITSARRVFAAGLAGYIGINMAALAAGIEFGLQPLLFTDAGGAPLYAPYPLAIAIPAMLAGHLTLAGLAEALAGSGLVAVLQRSEPELLLASMPAAGGRTATTPGRDSWQGTRRLWLGLGLMMLLTPLGLIAAGTAWGEWSAEDLANPQLRPQISAASGQMEPPQEVPAGLAALSGLWKAPIPDYAPAFLKDERLGYILSAVMGSGLVVLVFLGLGSLTGRRPPPAAPTVSRR